MPTKAELEEQIEELRMVIEGVKELVGADKAENVIADIREALDEVTDEELPEGDSELADFIRDIFAELGEEEPEK